MTELLSREKEFLKMNERLDKLALASQTAAGDKPPPAAAAAHATTPPASKPETRYGTYTKAKGPSTLLKKRGGGDCVVVPVTATGGDTSTRPSSRPHSGKSAAAAAVMRSSVTSPPGGDSNRKMSYASTASSQRRSIKTDSSSSRTVHRGSLNRVARNHDTFTVKYRNPKFVESPSLEVLVRDEQQSLREKAAEASHSSTPSTLDSMMSIGLSGTDSRRSQVSTNRKHISTEGLIKFLKSKITILEEDHERISEEMTEQKALLDKTMERQKKVESQRDQAYIKHNALTDQLRKMETQLEEANRCIRERSAEQLAQQKELEASKRELKVLRQGNVNLEKRLYHAHEELENTKKALAELKSSERRLKDALGNQNDLKDKTIKSLRQQRGDLMNAYKKQLYLMDNLKRQITCVEQTKVLAMTEKEFTKVLDWNAKPSN